jgi:hypothetical protein
VNTANPQAVLTSQEASRLHELEHIIEEGLESFLKIGLAFAEVRFNRLYRATHDTFESYCRDRWALSLSRCNQIISTVKVFDNISSAFPQDTALLTSTSEHTLRPLTRLEPDLQVATWELIRRIKPQPDGTTIQEVVDLIKDAIVTGWQERTERQLEDGRAGNPEPCHAPPADRNGNASSRPRTLPVRQSDQLGNLCRWAGRITSWDPEAIAMADDELCLKRRLKAARQLRTFCEALIRALEARLSN